MGLTERYECDACGKTLAGRYKMANVETECYISFKGTMSAQMFDKQTKEKDFCYITENTNQLYTFCNAQCFSDFFNARLEAEKKRKKDLETKQNVAEFGDSKIYPSTPYGSTFRVGTKRGY